jgi:hypothetical protein
MRTINLYGSSKGVGWGSSLPYGVEYGTATDAATLGKADHRLHSLTSLGCLERWNREAARPRLTIVNEGFVPQLRR